MYELESDIIRPPEAEMRTAGTDLDYTVEGTGLPCFVPRPLTTKVLERTLSSRLREQLQFVFFDFRGCGNSGGSLSGSSFEDVLADIDGLRVALGHEQIGLFGWSMFSLVGLDFALAYPDSVSALILAGSLPRWPNSDSYWESVASPQRKAQLAENLALELDGVQPSLPGAPDPDPVVRRRDSAIRYAAFGPRYWYDASFDCAPLYADDEWDLDQLD